MPLDIKCVECQEDKEDICKTGEDALVTTIVDDLLIAASEEAVGTGRVDADMESIQDTKVEKDNLGQSLSNNGVETVFASEQLTENTIMVVSEDETEILDVKHEEHTKDNQEGGVPDNETSGGNVETTSTLLLNDQNHQSENVYGTVTLTDYPEKEEGCNIANDISNIDLVNNPDCTTPVINVLDPSIQSKMEEETMVTKCSLDEKTINEDIRDNVNPIKIDELAIAAGTLTECSNVHLDEGKDGKVEVKTDHNIIAHNNVEIVCNQECLTGTKADVCSESEIQLINEKDIPPMRNNQEYPLPDKKESEEKTEMILNSVLHDSTTKQEQILNIVTLMEGTITEGIVNISNNLPKPDLHDDLDYEAYELEAVDPIMTTNLGNIEEASSQEGDPGRGTVHQDIQNHIEHENINKGSQENLNEQEHHLENASDTVSLPDCTVKEKTYNNLNDTSKIELIHNPNSTTETEEHDIAVPTVATKMEYKQEAVTIKCRPEGETINQDIRDDANLEKDDEMVIDAVTLTDLQNNHIDKADEVETPDASMTPNTENIEDISLQKGESESDTVNQDIPNHTELEIIENVNEGSYKNWNEPNQQPEKSSGNATLPDYTEKEETNNKSNDTSNTHLINNPNSTTLEMDVGDTTATTNMEGKDEAVVIKGSLDEETINQDIRADANVEESHKVAIDTGTMCSENTKENEPINGTCEGENGINQMNEALNKEYDESINDSEDTYSEKHKNAQEVDEMDEGNYIILDNGRRRHESDVEIVASNWAIAGEVVNNKLMTEEGNNITCPVNCESTFLTEFFDEENSGDGEERTAASLNNLSLNETDILSHDGFDENADTIIQNGTNKIIETEKVKTKSISEFDGKSHVEQQDLKIPKQTYNSKERHESANNEKETPKEGKGITFIPVIQLPIAFGIGLLVYFIFGKKK